MTCGSELASKHKRTRPSNHPFKSPFANSPYRYKTNPRSKPKHVKMVKGNFSGTGNRLESASLSHFCCAVSEVMTKDIEIVTPDTPLKEAAMKMKQNDTG